MSGALDTTTLGWVKQELDETLKQARQALEAYVDNPDDESQLRFCSVHLHQVYGTLQMVELYGAAMLAEELEKLALALLDNKVAQKEAAYELIMSGLVQLPDYLDRLSTGHRDVPIVLMPLLNDLRATRGSGLLSENALFNPDLDVEIPDNVRGEEVGEPLSDVTKQHRHQYQVALLGWFRDKDVAASLRSMTEVLAALRAASHDDAVLRLWWISEALIEALASDRLPVSMAVKLLLGQVDRQMKRVIDGGEAVLIEQAPVELLKNLLFYVARAERGGVILDRVKDAWRLDEMLPDEAEISDAQQSLSGHNLQLMESVAIAVREELQQIKDTLDLFVRGANTERAGMETVADGLGKIGDTLGMLGLGALRKRMLEQVEAARAMASGELDLNESDLMDLAASLLFVESSLDALVKGDISGVVIGEEENDSIVPEAEFQQVRGAVASEAIQDIARAKEAIIGYIEMPEEFSRLDEVPILFKQIKGGLLLLNEPRVAGILDGVLDFIEEGILASKTAPGEIQLNHLADAISAVEYYLENLREKKVFGGDSLQVAEQSLAQLGMVLPAAGSDAGVEVSAEKPCLSDVDRVEAPGVSNSADQDNDQQPGLTSSEDDQEIITIGLDAGEPVDMPEEEIIAIGIEDDLTEEAGEEEIVINLDEEKPGEDDEIDAINIAAQTDTEESVAEIISIGLDNGMAIVEDDNKEEISLSCEGGVTGSATGVSAEDFESPYPVLDNDDLDEEILEIFLEEAEEEIGNIREKLPKWIDNAEEKEAFAEARRSFHTLKGSGRLVGAMLLGEYAWAFENMFNRVIDGTVERSDAMLDLLGKVMDALPELLEQLKHGTHPEWDVLAMMPLAEALSHGESVEVGDLRRISAPPAEAESSDNAVLSDPVIEPEEDASDSSDESVEEEESDEAIIDPVLYEIFNTESQDHISVIRTFLAEGAGSASVPIDDDLVRAVHTLHGSARMAGAEEIAEIGGAFERYVKALQAERLPMNDDARIIVTQAVNQIEDMLPKLLDAAAVLPDYRTITLSIEGLPRTSRDLGVDPFPETVAENEDVELLEEPDEILTVEPDSESDAIAESEIESVTLSADESVVNIGESGAADGENVISITEAVLEKPAVSTASSSAYEDADDELIEVFLEEADEIMESSETTLLQWIEKPDDPELMASMQRDLHTLKGGARMADLTPIGDLTHSLESLLIAVTDGLVAPSDALFERLQLSQDRLVHMLEAVKTRQPLVSAEDLIADAEALKRGELLTAVEPATQDISSATAGEIDDVVETVSIPQFEKPAPVIAREDKQSARGQQEQVRIRAELLDDMVNNAGEISIYRSRLEQQVGVNRFNLNEMTQTLMRLREQLRKMEIETEAQVIARHEHEFVDEAHPDFDPLEMDRYSTLQTLSRAMMESINDLNSLQGMLEGVNRESETLLVQQSRVTTELQEGLMRTRMVPFSGLAPRMRRIVRQACQELGKRAELVLEGAEGEMDRTVIERITAPLEHMLRNAVAHGLEEAEQRRESGKNETGTITLTLMRDAADVVIRLTDDGRGMSLERIREKAIEKGMMSADANLTDNDIMQFVLETGFSTADEVSQIAGRGVGMDVVNSEVKQLGGSLHIDSEVGKGTTFTIRLPFTLAISQALLVQVHEDAYAIPLTSIEGVVRMSQEQLQQYYADPEKRFEYAGFRYEVRHLGSMLGHGEPVMGAGAPKRLPVLLVRAGDHHMALQVENLMGSRETVVKSVGPQISSVRGISGATILGDGRVVLILDLGGLVRAGAVAALAPAEPVAEVEEPSGPPLVMVVDDSITVRKVTTRLLERNDFQAVTAKDGVDAVAKLQEHMPDVMLLDIEMPRMDGFELATHIRNEPRLKHIPIIMITSRTGEKHRNRALDIGVNRYLGKPYQESDLLDNIRELLAEKTQHA